ncbi:MAG: hypothetical protein AAGL90_01490 [Pseudomonadota bacterium]
MKLPVATVLASALIGLSATADVPKLTRGDLEAVIGDEWTGQLTYLNYQAPFNDVTIRAALQASAADNGLKLDYLYPDEPNANSTVIAEIGADGTSFMGEPIVSNEMLEDDVRLVKTGYPCEDMGRAAMCEMTYRLAPTELRIKKMVTYDGETEAFRRNEYVFTR